VVPFDRVLPLGYYSAPMPPEARQPKVNAMLLCERVIHENGTGLVSLISIFENMTAEKLPVIIPMYVYAKMTEAQGEYQFKLEVVRRNDMKVIAEAELPPGTIDDPMANADITIQLGGLTFAEVGYYDFRLSANGRFVDSKSMQILLKSPSGE
jgi:Family of unknown function (DUF6941)